MSDEPSGRAGVAECRPVPPESARQRGSDTQADSGSFHTTLLRGYARTFPVFPHNLHARNARYRHYLAEVQNSFRLAFKHATPTPGATHQLSYQDATMAL